MCYILNLKALVQTGNPEFKTIMAISPLVEMRDKYIKSLFRTVVSHPEIFTSKFRASDNYCTFRGGLQM